MVPSIGELKSKTGEYQPELNISDNATLSPADATKAFRPWISAELLKNQVRWLVRQSRRQNRKKNDILKDVLAAWIGQHPEDRLTKPQLFNIMRAAVGEFIVLHEGAISERDQMNV
jgi:hypothetical protein